jgi:hypothetical protein
MTHAALMSRVAEYERGAQSVGIARPRCNAEKGRRWDSGRLRKRDPMRYDAMVERLLSERERRWREPGSQDIGYL